MSRRLAIRFELNLKLLSLKTVRLFLCIFPFFTRPAIKVLGPVKGMLIMLSRRRKWKNVRSFTKYCGNPARPWRFLLHFFCQAGILRIWANLAYEFPERFRLEDMARLAELKDAFRERRGAILLGAHYGPVTENLILRREDMKVTQLVSRIMTDRRKFMSQALLSRQVRFFDLEMKAVPCGSEVSLIRALRNGELIGMFIDNPAGISESPVEFLGKQLRLSRFPFKLSLRYGSPLFVMLAERDRKDGYIYRLTRLSFSTVEEGLNKYLALLEKNIRCDPFLWSSLPDFMEW